MSHLNLLQSENKVLPGRLTRSTGSEEVSKLTVRELVDAAVSSHGEIAPHASRRLELHALDSTGSGLEALQ